MGLLNRLSLKLHVSRESHDEALPASAAPQGTPPPFDLVDSLLPREPEQRRKIYEALDNASLAALRRTSRAVAHESRPVLLARKWPEIAAAKPPEVDAQALVQSVRAFDAQAQAWEQKPWRGTDLHAPPDLAYDPQRLPPHKELKQVQKLLRKHPQQLSLRSLEARLRHDVGDSVGGHARDASLFAMDDTGLRHPIQERHLLPSARRLEAFAAQSLHWSMQATFLLDVMRRERRACDSNPVPVRVRAQEVAWLQQMAPSIKSLAAHSAIVNRLAWELHSLKHERGYRAPIRPISNDEMLAQVEEHLTTARAVHAALAPQERPVGAILLARLEQAVQAYRALHALPEAWEG